MRNNYFGNNKNFNLFCNELCSIISDPRTANKNNRQSISNRKIK